MRYYLDYGSAEAKAKAKAKAEGGPAPNALVIWPENGFRVEDGQRVYEGLAAVYPWRNSQVATTGIGARYLRNCCRRTSREVAHGTHPNLAVRDQETTA